MAKNYARIERIIDMNFENKLAIIVNKEIEIGKAINAVVHCSLSLGSILEKHALYIKWQINYA